MRRSLTFLVLSTILSISAVAGTSVTAPTAPAILETVPNRCQSLSHSSLSALPAACCKVCHQGKACGNTCIAREKICHIGKGCACDE
jgi:hypothetical protein